MLLIKNQLCKNGQKDFVKVEKTCKTMIVLVVLPHCLQIKKVEEEWKLIWSDRHLTVCEIAEECHISQGSVQSILAEKFGTGRVSAKLVPKILTLEQKAERVAVATEML